ncbi:MAG: hypothetical protein ISEC1_P1920 [Thiomicrorhabdus sp.]|nr:MAG: hypothetical protein ISEC1_P1920 [Thiomicrorhabdus sp.]
MPDMEEVGSALLFTVGFVVIAVVIVGLAMWWVHRFFKNNDEKRGL